MPKLYSSTQVLKVLNRAGFVVVSQKGSHIKLKGTRNNIIRVIIVPNHREIALGTFSSILKQADITRIEFEAYL